MPHRKPSLKRNFPKHRHFAAPTFGGSGAGGSKNTDNNENVDTIIERMGKSLQEAAGPLYEDHLDDDNQSFISQIALHDNDGRSNKRILVLCTGGTLTMAPDSTGALAPVEGALSRYMQDMHELKADNMPAIVLHEYSPFYDSSDLGPADWARVAKDIKDNYLHFDGFVVLTGTDTMAYFATALSFMLENLGKPVVFTGSQIPLSEPYNDARRNLIMSLIFASRDTINEVSIFFHDKLLRGNRATKFHTHKLGAFDSPNMDPLAKIGITIDENDHLLLLPAKGQLRIHTRLETRLLTIRLVPGFDDIVLRSMVEANLETKNLRALVLQLYGTGNMPQVKKSFVQLLADARSNGILVVAASQCHTGSVMMGQYAVTNGLEKAGVISASDMTLEAVACKLGYLFGRGDISNDEVSKLMSLSLRGEVTPVEALSPPSLSSAYQRAMRKGKRFY